MKLKPILAALALSISSLSIAGQISGSSNITFLAFDGQKVKKSTKLQVNDTQPHQVVVEISSIYESGSDSAFFESQPLVIRFNGSQEDIKIIAPNLRTSRDVEKFKTSPTVKVQTTSGKSLEAKLDYLKGEGFMPNSNISENLATYNSEDNIASVKSFSTKPMMGVMPSSNGKASKGKVMVQGENIAEQQLQYWFQQADKQTQKRFLDWAKKQ